MNRISQLKENIENLENDKKTLTLENLQLKKQIDKLLTEKEELLEHLKILDEKSEFNFCDYDLYK